MLKIWCLCFIWCKNVDRRPSYGQKRNSKWRPPPSWIYFRSLFLTYSRFSTLELNHRTKFGAKISIVSWQVDNRQVSQQCQAATSKATRILGIINHTIVFKHSNILIRLYKSLVRPHLEYCTAAWSPHYCKDKQLIEKVQRRFTRMIPDLKDLPYEQRLAKTKLWSLEDRRIRADLIEVYKIIHGLSTVSSNTFFEFSHNRITRGLSEVTKESCINWSTSTFFSERVINQWNKLNEDAVTAPTLNSFKGKIQSLYNDGSFTRLIKSAWPSGPSQFPGEAQSGKLSDKLSFMSSCQRFNLTIF